MKRFYCKTCQKIRYVRRYPAIIENAQSVIPSERVGECNWHHKTIRGQFRPANTAQSDGRMNRKVVR